MMRTNFKVHTVFHFTDACPSVLFVILKMKSIPLANEIQHMHLPGQYKKYSYLVFYFKTVKSKSVNKIKI